MEGRGHRVTRGVFESQMARLRVLRFPPADLAEFWAALKDIPDEPFTAGVGHATRTRGDHPVPAELRADVDAVARRVAPQAVHPTSRMVPIEGTVTAVIRNPLRGVDGKPGKGITVTVSSSYRPDCDDCDDSGHVLFWCGEPGPTKMPWTYIRSCERRHPDGWTGGHDWAAECPCVATNPTIQRRKAMQQQRFSSEPERIGR